MAPRTQELDLPGLAEENATFETYKHCPALLGESECFPLRGASGAGVVDVPVASGRVPTALEAEARALAISAALIPLFGGAAAAVVLGGGGAAVVGLAAGGDVLHVDCGAPVLSLARIAGSEAPREGGGSAEAVLASCKGGRLAVITVSRSAGSGCLRAELGEVAHVPAPEGSAGAAPLEGDGDVYVTSALAVDGGRVLALAHRVVGKHEVEVSAVQLEATTCRLLATLRGRCAPRVACWFAPSCVMLVAGAGYELQASPALAPCVEGEDCKAPDDRAFAYEGCDCVLTALRLHADPQAPEVGCWRVSRGELLGAWVESASSDGAAAEEPGDQRRLGVMIADGHTALTLGLALPLDAGAAPIVAGIARSPGLGACAAARSNLRLALASPGRTFMALVETTGRSPVAVFRRPEGSSRAPTAAPELGEPGGAVYGAFLDDTGVVVLQRGQLTRCSLNASAAVAEVPRRLAERSELPMGIDPKALLQMLDAHGED